MKIVGIITARMASTRLPGKVMKLLAGKTVLAHHLERMFAVEGLSGVYLATACTQDNDELVAEAHRCGVQAYQGSEEDILERHIAIAELEHADAVLRVTCDSPVFDLTLLSDYCRGYAGEDYFYPSNMTLAQGTAGELISLNALERCHEHYRGPAITQYIKEHLPDFRTRGFPMRERLCRPEVRLTLDYPEDLRLFEVIFDELYKGGPFDLAEVYTFLDDNPHLININRQVAAKSVESYGDMLLTIPEFRVVRFGPRTVIYDKQGRVVEYPEFLEELAKLFPGMGSAVPSRK